MKLSAVNAEVPRDTVDFFRYPLVETNRNQKSKVLENAFAVSSFEEIINAYVNGCLNIERKELGDEWLKKLLEPDEV